MRCRQLLLHHISKHVDVRYSTTIHVSRSDNVDNLKRRAISSGNFLLTQSPSLMNLVYWSHKRPSLIVGQERGVHTDPLLSHAYIALSADVRLKLTISFNNDKK